MFYLILAFIITWAVSFIAIAVVVAAFAGVIALTIMALNSNNPVVVIAWVIGLISLVLTIVGMNDASDEDDEIEMPEL